MIEEYNVVWLLAFCNQHVRKNIDDWDMKAAIDMMDDISKYYGIKFERRLRTITKRDGEYNVKVEILENSGIYYVDCYTETIEDLKVKPTPDWTLIARLENLGLTKVVHNVRNENLTITFPLELRDLVIDNEGNIIDTGV